MRTVDPELWSQKLKKPAIKVTRSNNFGMYPGLRCERIIRKSLVDAAKEFWANCSIPLVKLINLEDNSKLERYYYSFLLVLSLGLGIVIVPYNCYKFYTIPPLVINGLPSQASIAKVHFPAVALCSNNIISGTALRNYTEFLFNHPKNQKGPRYNRTVIEEHLLKLGALLMMARPPVQLHFDKFLTDVHPQFNVTDVMFRLSPPCTSILERCSWRGRQVPCDTLFASRVTPLGFCCVFNSRYYPVDANNQPHVLDLIGHNLGLGVVITENKDDFKYIRRNTNGAEMLLFEGSEYPLLESGDVRLYPLPRNNSLHFNIKVMTQHAHDDVKLFSEKYRGCRTEGAGMSQCLAACQRDTAAAICSCVPYTLHAALHHDERRVCSYRHVYCLNKHREKFLYLFPPTADKDDPQISEELQNGIYCPECVVLCKRQLYWAGVSYVQYNGGDGLFRNFLTEGLRLINSTTIRLFYAPDHYKQFALEPYARWYEVLAILSTEWMALAGTSVVVVLEVVYYFTFRWIYHFIRRKRLGDLGSLSM